MVYLMAPPWVTSWFPLTLSPSVNIRKQWVSCNKLLLSNKTHPLRTSRLVYSFGGIHTKFGLRDFPAEHGTVLQFEVVLMLWLIFVGFAVFG